MIKLMLKFGARVDTADDQGATALMHAIDAGVEIAVANLLELGASVDAEDKNKRRPLHVAAIRGSEPILNLILTKDPDLDRLDTSGRTALSHAVGFADLARILLEKGANPNLAANDGYTPLAISAWYGYSKTVELLLSHGAHVNLQFYKAKGGWTAVGIAAENDRPETVKLLVDAGALLSLKMSDGSTALHAATPSTARVLLQHKKRLNIDEPNDFKTTPLHYAIQFSQSTEVAKLLIDSGANLNLQDRDGATPLSCAASGGNNEVVKMLLQEEDCDKSLTSRSGESPLHHAARRADLETMKLLVEGGVATNLVGNAVCDSPLQVACENAKDHTEIVEYLLENGADLHAQVGTKGFAVASAALNGTPGIISLLLERGATVNVADLMGRTPIHMACAGGAVNFQEIYKAGGNQQLRVKDKLQRTVFHWAAQHCWPEVLESLIAELGTDLIDAKDIDGWTPLLWACWPGWLKGVGSGPAKDDDAPEQRQARVFRILLENGANRDVTGKIGDSVWSLRDVALLNKIETSWLQLGEDDLPSEPIAVEPAVSSETTGLKKGRIGALINATCRSCYYVSDFLSKSPSVLCLPGSLTFATTIDTLTCSAA